MNGSGSSSGWNVYTSTNGNATRQYLQNSSSRASSRPDDMIILEHIEYREEVPITPPPEMGATHPPIGFPTVTIDTPSPRIIPSSWNADLERAKPGFQNNINHFLSKHVFQRFNAGFGIGLLAGVGLVYLQRYLLKAMK